MSKKAVAKQFNVSRSTLQFRLKKPVSTFIYGPCTVFTEVKEKLLQAWISVEKDSLNTRETCKLVSNNFKIITTNPILLKTIYQANYYKLKLLKKYLKVFKKNQ